MSANYLIWWPTEHGPSVPVGPTSHIRDSDSPAWFHFPDVWMMTRLHFGSEGFGVRRFHSASETRSDFFSRQWRTNRTNEGRVVSASLCCIIYTFIWSCSDEQTWGRQMSPSVTFHCKKYPKRRKCCWLITSRRTPIRWVTGLIKKKKKSSNSTKELNM